MMPSEFPPSIRAINNLPKDEKESIYATLLPDTFGGEGEVEGVPNCKPIIKYRCPTGSRAMEVVVKRQESDIDPLMYLNMADTFNNQLIVLLVVVNDLDSPRYNTDIDGDGNRTQFGTASRNLSAERAAMEAGLAPGQIRRGLRMFKRTVPVFEEFVSRMGHDIFFIEPLSYANAIVFEKYGFHYLSGHQEMQRIHKEFLPGGDLIGKLTPDNPFRLPDAWKTIRRRAWAIHDGILGYPFTGFQMYKRVGMHSGINTFPDATW
jgi:hypothetical protein